MCLAQARIAFRRVGKVVTRHYPGAKTGGALTPGRMILLDTLDGYHYYIFGPDLRYYMGYGDDEPTEVEVIRLLAFPSRSVWTGKVRF